jgi:hypothetical protein
MSGVTNNIDDIVRQFAGVVRSQVIATRLNQQQLCVELLVKIFEGVKVLRDILTHFPLPSASWSLYKIKLTRSVRAPPSLNGLDALSWQSLMTH